MKDKYILFLLLLLGPIAVFCGLSFFDFRQAEVLASGKNYFVSPSGNDKNSGQEEKSPLKSIQTALKKAKAGDAINLLAGEYRENIKTVRRGTVKQPIIIKGPRGAVLKGKGNDRVVEINHSYIRLEGFTIDGQRNEGKKEEDFADKLIYILGKEKKKKLYGLKISDMEIKNAGGECIRLRYLVQKSEIKNNTIKNCGIHDFRFNAGGKNGEAIYIGTAPEQRKDGKNPTSDVDKSDQNWIHDNYIETKGNECVDIKEGSSMNVVEKNKCTGQKDPESGGMDSRGNNNIFRDNEIFDNIGAGIRFGGDGQRDGIKNIAKRNVLRNNLAGGIKIERKPQREICGNTFLNNGNKDFFGKYASTQKVISCKEN